MISPQPFLLHDKALARVLVVLLLSVLPSASFLAQGVMVPAVFPEPREIASSGGDFMVDDGVAIVLPKRASPEDVRLAESLSRELTDRFGVQVKKARLAKVDASRRVILMGSVANSLVAGYCAKAGISVNGQRPGPEGYVLRVEPGLVLIAGSDDRGAFYGLQSLRQLAERGPEGLRFRGVKVRDWPDKPFRGIKLYLPGRNNIPFFKRFVRDFMALYKYNTLIMEMNAGLRLDRHPELNSRWLEFAREVNYSRRNYPPGTLHKRQPNSSHQDTADGGFLEKEEVADLARWIRQQHIELVPELPSFTHSYYLLSAHPELAEVPGEKWPDTYCLSNPKSYQLLFDVYDEYIELLHPKMIHAGHDELFAPVGLCPLCKDKDIGERFGEDVRKIHDYLARRGIKMAIWGDMLLQEVRGKGLQKSQTDDGWTFHAAGGMTPDQVARLVPKDVLIFNWFWHQEDGSWDEPQAEQHEARLEQMGFEQVFGNFVPGIQNYDARRKRSSLLGAAPSAWFATGEEGFGKDLLPDFLFCSTLLWNGRAPEGKDLSGLVQTLLPGIRTRFRGALPPSQTETSIAPVDIRTSFNTTGDEPALGVVLGGMITGPVRLGRIPFDLATAGGKSAIMVGTDGSARTGLPAEVSHINVGVDATSLIFLHACAQPAANREQYRLIWDAEDTADLLGWYEVVYEDGFVLTIPIRYGVNIQEWDWHHRASARDYCYGADAVAVGTRENSPLTLFAFEWTNPRLGKIIREVRLKGTTGFRGAPAGFTDDYGPTLTKNGVILKALTAVKKRS
jgi:hypothetical protein